LKFSGPARHDNHITCRAVSLAIYKSLSCELLHSTRCTMSPAGPMVDSILTTWSRNKSGWFAAALPLFYERQAEHNLGLRTRSPATSWTLKPSEQAATESPTRSTRPLPPRFSDQSCPSRSHVLLRHQVAFSAPCLSHAPRRNLLPRSNPHGTPNHAARQRSPSITCAALQRSNRIPSLVACGPEDGAGIKIF
jgi:hypothetical protein